MDEVKVKQELENIVDEQRFDLAATKASLYESRAQNVKLQEQNAEMQGQINTLMSQMQEIMARQAQSQQVMSPSGASGTGLSQEQIDMLAAAASHGQTTGMSPNQDYVHVSIPTDIAASIYGRMTQKQMEAKWREEQAANRAANTLNMPANVKAFFDQNRPIFGVPTIKQMTLGVSKFSGKEEYQGLGANFREWGLSFMREIAIAQLHSGFWWKDDDKIHCLQKHLEGKALSYFMKQSPQWTKNQPYLEYVMIRMDETYRVHLTTEQSVELFLKPKPKNRSWCDHLTYLVEISHAAGGQDEMVLTSIMKYAAPELRTVLMARAGSHQGNPLLEAERLANIAQQLTLSDRSTKTLGRETNMVSDEKGDTVASVEVKCNYCGKKGHKEVECRKKKRDNEARKPKRHDNDRKSKSEEKKAKNWSLCVTDKSPISDRMNLIANCGTNQFNRLETSQDGTPVVVEWVLDSGCGRHLTGTPELLGSSVTSTNTSLYLPDGSKIQSTKIGDVSLKMETEEEQNNVMIKNVELVPGFQRNLLSYVRLEEKGIRLLYVGNKRYLAKTPLQNKTTGKHMKTAFSISMFAWAISTTHPLKSSRLNQKAGSN